MFHAKNGWYFERTVNGGVHIVKKKDAHVNAPVMAQIYLEHNEWSSVIASVSHRGETGESFRDAEKYHGRNLGGTAAPLPENEGER
jgi:hypothetical protein